LSEGKSSDTACVAGHERDFRLNTIAWEALSRSSAGAAISREAACSIGEEKAGNVGGAREMVGHRPEQYQLPLDLGDQLPPQPTRLSQSSSPTSGGAANISDGLGIAQQLVETCG
jgi:hypothetical protein